MEGTKGEKGNRRKVGWTYRASTDVPNLPALDNVVQRLHDLLARGIPVQTVDLQYIDVRAQTFHAGVDGIEDMLARQAGTVDKGAVVFGGCGDGWELALVVDAEETLG